MCFLQASIIASQVGGLQFDRTQKHLLAHKSAYFYILMRIKMI